MVTESFCERVEFVDKHLALLADNLDPDGREYLLSIIRAAAEVRSRAAAARKARRNELVRNLADRIAPDGSANLAAGKMVQAANEYVRNQYAADRKAHRRPINEPEKTIFIILEKNNGKFPAERTIRALLA